MSERLDLLEYQALVTFLAHAKDRNDLSEVSSRFEARFNRRVRFALLKILDALDLPSRSELLVIASIELTAIREKQLQEELAEIERLQAENAAYYDYVSGKLTLGQLEAALSRVEPIYQQKPVEEWVTGSPSPASHSQTEQETK